MWTKSLVRQREKENPIKKRPAKEGKFFGLANIFAKRSSETPGDFQNVQQ